MGTTNSGKENKSSGAEENAEFMRYCDSLVQRSLEAVSLIRKNRNGRPRHNR